MGWPGQGGVRRSILDRSKGAAAVLLMLEDGGSIYSMGVIRLRRPTPLLQHREQSSEAMLRSDACFSGIECV